MFVFCAVVFSLFLRIFVVVVGRGDDLKLQIINYSLLDIMNSVLYSNMSMSCLFNHQ